MQSEMLKFLSLLSISTAISTFYTLIDKNEGILACLNLTQLKVIELSEKRHLD